MARNLTEQERQRIRDIFESGCGVRETARYTNTSVNTVRNIVGKNRRSHSESCLLARGKGTYRLTDEGRARISASAKKACQRSGKVWTKPEREFKIILNECGFGVRFSDDIKEMFGLSDDKDATVFFQYPLQRYVCDYVDVVNKIVYLVNGDFWHANPLLYDKNNLTTIQKHNVSHDIARERYLACIGYKVCIIWESEINWNRDLVRSKIRAVSSEAAASRLHREGRDFEIPTAHLDWSEKVKKLWFKPKKDKATISLKCVNCNSDIILSAHNKRSQYRRFCSTACASNVRRKIIRPSREQLADEVKETNFCAVARKYGVSDNAIRKWLK